MGQLDVLRKMIREEVRTVFQEELAGILKEAIISNRGEQQAILETSKPKKPTIPGTLNKTVQRPVIPITNPNDPLAALLAETATSMTPSDFGNMGTGDIEKPTQVVESVNDMFASARKSSNLEFIEINDIPDFTNVMQKMGI